MNKTKTNIQQSLERQFLNTTPILLTQWLLTGSSVIFFNVILFFFFFGFLGPHPRHVEVPRLGVSSEPNLRPIPQLTATPDP